MQLIQVHLDDGALLRRDADQLPHIYRLHWAQARTQSFALTLSS